VPTLATLRNKRFQSRQMVAAGQVWASRVSNSCEGDITVKTAIQSSLFALAGSVVVSATAGHASAQDASRLAEADANGDGNIEWQEMLDMRADIFERLDRNGDGVANSSDSPRFGPGKSKFNEALGKLKDADANGDGQITQTEMMDAPSPLFEAGDTDGDKVLSSDELAALRDKASEQM